MASQTDANSPTLHIFHHAPHLLDAPVCIQTIKYILLDPPGPQAHLDTQSRGDPLRVLVNYEILGGKRGLVEDEGAILSRGEALVVVDDLGGEEGVESRGGECVDGLDVCAIESLQICVAGHGGGEQDVYPTDDGIMIRSPSDLVGLTRPAPCS